MTLPETKAASLPTSALGVVTVANALLTHRTAYGGAGKSGLSTIVVSGSNLTISRSCHVSVAIPYDLCKSVRNLLIFKCYGCSSLVLLDHPAFVTLLFPIRILTFSSLYPDVT